MLRRRMKPLTPELLLNLRRYLHDRVGLARTAPEHAPADRLASVASGDLVKALCRDRRRVAQRARSHRPLVSGHRP